MAKTVIDALVVTLGLDAKGFKKGAAEASKAQDDLRSAAEGSAKATEQANARAGKSSAALGARAKKEAEAETKRNRIRSDQRRRQTVEDKKFYDTNIEGIKSLGRMAATAVLGFEGVKGAILAYASTTNQLAGLGRLAPTVGVNPQQLNAMGNLYKQFGGKQEDAASDISRIAHAQFSYPMGAPDAFAAWTRRQGIALFDQKGKNLNPTQVIDQIRDALRRMTPDIQAQAMYAREMGLSEAFINTELLTTTQQRQDATKQAEATAAATERSTEAAKGLSTAWGRVTNAVSAAKQKFVGGTAGVAARSMQDAAKEFQKGGIGNWAAGGLDILGAGIFPLLKALGLPYYDENGRLDLGRGASAFLGLGGTSRERAALFATERKYGLPAGVLSGIAQRESNFNPAARNAKSGAVGLMQLMPQFFPGAGVDEIQDIDSAGRYLQQLLKKYGSLQLALAAYNAGPGTVDSRIRSGRTLPAETRAYVPSVLTGMANAAAAAGFASAATMGAGPARASGTSALAGSGSTTNVDIDTINIHTQASDAVGIAATIPDALQRKGVVSQANTGMN